jgi:hypothetical protein
MAGIDGFWQRLYEVDGDWVIDESRYRLSLVEIARLCSVSDSRAAALADDHAFLLRDKVFTDDVITAYAKRNAVVGT